MCTVNKFDHICAAITFDKLRNLRLLLLLQVYILEVGKVHSSIDHA